MRQARANKLVSLTLCSLLLLLAACAQQAVAPTAMPTVSATPTIDPDIYNKVPKTTVFPPGQCTVVLNAPAPAYASNTIGGPSSGEIPAGKYQVDVAADYGSSLWYGLNGVEGANYINSTSVSSTEGDCATAN